MLDGRRGRLAVSRDVIGKMIKASDSGWIDSLVYVEDNGERKYMASLDLFHEIHCLVSTFKADEVCPCSDKLR